MTTSNAPALVSQRVIPSSNAFLISRSLSSFGHRQLLFWSQFPLQQSEQSVRFEGSPVGMQPHALSLAQSAEQHWLELAHALLSGKQVLPSPPSPFPASPFPAGQKVEAHWLAQSEHAHFHQLVHSFAALVDAALSQLRGQLAKFAHLSMQVLRVTHCGSPLQFLS